MTEPEWAECMDPKLMLRHLNGAASDRKLRLFLFACIRRFWQHLPNDPLRKAVEASERHADGEITDGELGPAVTEANRFRPKRSDLGRAAYDAARYSPGRVNWYSVTDDLARYAASDQVHGVPPTAMSFFEGGKLVSIRVAMNPKRAAWNAARDRESAAQCDLLRGIIGNPFRLATPAESSLTPAVVNLARTIYKDRSFGRMSELADALERAGCGSKDILHHCCSAAPHVRGCWVVDLILGNT